MTESKEFTYMDCKKNLIPSERDTTPNEREPLLYERESRKHATYERKSPLYKSAPTLYESPANKLPDNPIPHSIPTINKKVLRHRGRPYL